MTFLLIALKVTSTSCSLQWLWKNTGKKVCLSEPRRFAYLQTQQIYKLQQSDHLDSTSIDLCSKGKTHTHISWHLHLSQWRLISLTEEGESESNGIWRGRGSAYLCLGLSLATPVERWDPTPVPILCRDQQGEWMWVSIQTQNLTPSNNMITIWEQQEGHPHVENHNWLSFKVADLNGLLCTMGRASRSFPQLCVPLAKGRFGSLPHSDCLLAPVANGLLYHLSGNLLSTHTQTQKGFFPPHFA